MHPEQVKEIFDQQASSYDKQWAKLAPLRDALHLLTGAVFSELPIESRVLCVGAGTGAEVIYFAQRFPRWTFTAVEPSGRMLDMCRRQAEECGVFDRCSFHEGFLNSLPPAEPFDAATCFLVSQFLLEREVRSEFFRTIAQRLRSGAILASSDLSSDVSSGTYRNLLDVWFRVMAAADVPSEAVERMRAAYGRDVSVLPVKDVEEIIQPGGFEAPVQFFQVGLIHAWYSRRVEC